MQVGEWRFTSGLLEPARKIARAHAKSLCEFIHGELRVEKLVQIILRALDELILVLLVEQRCTEAGLPGARPVNQQGLAAPR